MDLNRATCVCRCYSWVLVYFDGEKCYKLPWQWDPGLPSFLTLKIVETWELVGVDEKMHGRFVSAVGVGIFSWNDLFTMSAWDVLLFFLCSPSASSRLKGCGYYIILWLIITELGIYLESWLYQEELNMESKCTKAMHWTRDFAGVRCCSPTAANRATPTRSLHFPFCCLAKMSSRHCFASMQGQELTAGPGRIRAGAEQAFRLCCCPSTGSVQPRLCVRGCPTACWGPAGNPTVLTLRVRCAVWLPRSGL